MKFNWLFILLITGPLFSQDSLNYEWKSQQSYNLGKNKSWSVDALENIYIEDKDVINKFDSVGVLKYSQSIKFLGEMTQLEPINTMKLVHFSEDQQTICYLDNTLSPTDDCIELIDENVINATCIAKSERSDKLWVFDNVNSTLYLLDLEGEKDQSVKIVNLLGLLGANGVDKMIEWNSRLYILDTTKGIYELDMYGNLLQYLEYPSVVDFDVNRKLYLIVDNQLVVYDLRSLSEVRLDLPVSDVQRVSIVNNKFILGTSKIVHKYALEN